MSRAPATFKKRDVQMALEAATAAGLRVTRVEIGKDGKIVLVTDDAPSACADKANAWDEILYHSGDTQPSRKGSR